MNFYEFTISSTEVSIYVNLDEIVYFTQSLQNANRTVLMFNNTSVIVKESYNKVKEIIRNARDEYYSPRGV